jgi:hypothetical protein
VNLLAIPSQSLKHRTADDEDPLLLALHPLDDIVGALGQTGARRVRAGDAVELEVRAGPGEGDVVAADAMDNFEVGVLGVCRGVQVVIEVHESGGCQCVG